MSLSREPKQSTPITKPTIGRSEKIELPDLGLKNVDAKVDTGAFTSSIHCNLIDVVMKDGRKMLRVIPLRYTDSAYMGDSFYFPYSEKRKVKNSFGKVEERYMVEISVQMFGRRILTEFSLTDRSRMKYPILLGRKFLKGNFVVDVSLKDRSIKNEAKLKKRNP